jgi:(R)-2-hydroxyacyl-CoA dehydratese activating ATPase
VKITTTCTVFAESEIISWLARGKKAEDVLMGVHQAIAARSLSLMRRVGIEEEVTFTGGVTRNIAMVRILEDLIGTRLNVSPDAHYIGAIGAALFALDRAMSGAAGAVEAVSVETALEAHRHAPGESCEACAVAGRPIMPTRKRVTA